MTADKSSMFYILPPLETGCCVSLCVAKVFVFFFFFSLTTIVVILIERWRRMVIPWAPPAVDVGAWTCSGRAMPFRRLNVSSNARLKRSLGTGWKPALGVFIDTRHQTSRPDTDRFSVWPVEPRAGSIFFTGLQDVDSRGLSASTGLQPAYKNLHLLQCPHRRWCIFPLTFLRARV